MRNIYILKEIAKDRIYTSFMLKPLADKIEKDRRTLKNWIENPYLAQRNGYEIKEGRHLTGLKGNQDE
jgi:hypothetical protein